MVNTQVEEVRATLSSGEVCKTTVTTLHCLLGLDTTSNQPHASKKTAVVTRHDIPPGKPTTVRNGKTTLAKPKKPQALTILEDRGAKPLLSEREKYALATQTVNICLKLLTDSLRAQQRRSEGRKSPPPTAEAPSTPPRALQPRSANSTPVCTPLEKSTATQKKSSTPALTLTSTAGANIVAAAECTRLAFGYLRNADPKAIAVRELPKFQLETGMLAFVGKLIGHGLHEMAVKELAIVKRSLEAAIGCPKNLKPMKPSTTLRAASSKASDPVVDLLALDVTCDHGPESIAVAISFHQHVLKLIPQSHDPAAAFEAVSKFHHLDTPNGLVDLILRHAKHVNDATKAAKWLETFSQTLLSLCPSVAAAADDSSRHISPTAVLKLQVLALQARKRWWRLAKHEPDMSKELLEPFWKCASAFVRRCKDGVEVDVSGILTNSMEGLGPFVSRPALFNLHNLICSQAEREGRLDRALECTRQMLSDCSTLEPNHARSVAANVRVLTISLPHLEPERADQLLNLLSKSSLSSLTGGSEDYDILLASLVALNRALPKCRGVPTIRPLIVKILELAAGFAQRYARSYPGRSTPEILAVIETTLRLSKSCEDILGWVTSDIANLFVSAGILKSIANVASKRPLNEAWSISTAAVSLGRVLHALVLRAVRCISGAKSHLSFFDDDTLDSAERGMLLEWQLRYFEELATRSKYDTALKKLIPDLLRRLSQVYPMAEFPVRRTRAAFFILHLREGHPELVPPHVFQIWHDELAIDEASLGFDVGLQGYCKDVITRLEIARMFSDGGRPTIEDLKPGLQLWQQILDGSETRQALGDRIDDPQALAQQLRSIAAYFSMLGEGGTALSVQRLLTRLHGQCEDDSSATCASLVGLAQQYMEMCYSEKATFALAQARVLVEQPQTSGLAKLQLQLAQAEYLLASGDLAKCRGALDEARNLRSNSPPENVSREQRRTYELLHARGWLLQSKYLLETGSPHEALAAAKWSVRVLNSLWSALERSAGKSKSELPPDKSEEVETSVNGLTKGVSKLNLTPTDDAQPKESQELNKEGAAFWPLVPLLTKALTHLSDMYTHHGLFNEANYYSERASSIAESVGSTVLLSRVRSHRSRLLTLAGRLEEAELCLAQDEVVELGTYPLAHIERLCAIAAIRVKEGSLGEALRLYEEAESVVIGMSSDNFLDRMESFGSRDTELEKRMDALSLDPSTERTNASKQTAPVAPKRARRRPPKEPTTATKTGQGPAKARSGAMRAADQLPKQEHSPINLRTKLKADILLQKAAIRIRLGGDATAVMTSLDQLQSSSTYELLRQRQVTYQHLMRRAVDALQTDVTLNILPESTIAFPALKSTAQRLSANDEGQNTKPLPRKAGVAVTKAKTAGPRRKKRDLGNDDLETLLNAARECFLEGFSMSVQFRGTVQTQAECSSLSDVSLLLSAITNDIDAQGLAPAKEGLVLELPRMKALQFEQRATAVDAVRSDNLEVLKWPGNGGDSFYEAVTASEFQESYIDIIPKSWTAVSLCLNGDGSELYLARYRSEQSPLILKLPFARHKSEDPEEEVFDYHKGKAELNEIIELSNYTCHNSGSLEAKGAKTKWWSEREALDRRLHELLINIENIWFGGFKTIFSQHTIQADLLSRFRKSFDQILDRYLPSRKSSKDDSRKPKLDDKVLELFVGLGGDQDGTIDLEGPLADLLYFVVDMLQFSGERNAYDEIDFDGMAVDVLDVLRAYHEESADGCIGSQHLILVLDRRLQAFPWENLPCLEGTSVSRVGSMLSLRECIAAMRSYRSIDSAAVPANDRASSHVVSRGSGTYILNPSSDLPGTQTTLQPALSDLTKAQDHQWSSIVQEAPDEERFSSALKSSSVLLYFGHGGGSQYIRPRSIKRLERCSEVVWLMGCSSGSVWEHGDLEPCAIPLTYLLAGSREGPDVFTETESDRRNRKCMCVVATLWDVTDKDIDRFSLAIGEEWGLWPASESHRLPAKTPRKREIIAAPSTPPQVPKTPKTPKARKTPAPAKTPARSRSRLSRDGSRKLSLVEAVARSRDSCYLRYLNGAAPVVYGVPVYLGD